VQKLPPELRGRLHRPPQHGGVRRLQFMREGHHERERHHRLLPEQERELSRRLLLRILGTPGARIAQVDGRESDLQEMSSKVSKRA
jgi:hypothetical protein